MQGQVGSKILENGWNVKTGLERPVRYQKLYNVGAKNYELI